MAGRQTIAHLVSRRSHVHDRESADDPRSKNQCAHDPVKKYSRFPDDPVSKKRPLHEARLSRFPMTSNNNWCL
jgi:hypothetical protein